MVIAGRNDERNRTVAAEIGADVGVATVDLSKPKDVAAGLAHVGAVDRLVVSAIDRDENSVADYDIDRAIGLVTTKLVGYTAVVNALLDRMGPDSSTVLFGGMAKDRPYPGSTTVTTVNGGISTLVRTMVVELKPRRFNAIHPAVVGDHPYWMAKPAGVLDDLVARTPLGRLVTTEEVVRRNRVPPRELSGERSRSTGRRRLAAHVELASLAPVHRLCRGCPDREGYPADRRRPTADIHRRDM